MYKEVIDGGYIFFSMPIPECPKNRRHRWGKTEKGDDGSRLKYCLKCECSVFFTPPKIKRGEE